MNTLEEKKIEDAELRELVAGDPYAMRAYVEAPDEIRSAEPGSPMKFVATTSGVKRDGLDLRIEGVDVSNFERNPVFLWAHNYSMPPLGKVTKIRRLKNRIEMWVVFDQKDEFAVEIERKYRDGFLTAVSIGWIILEFERAAEEDEARYVVLRSDLLDLSAVPVPGDPDALLPKREIVAMRSLAKQRKLEASTTLVSNTLLDEIADQLGVERSGASFIEKAQDAADDFDDSFDRVMATVRTPTCNHRDADGDVDWNRVATDMVRLLADGTSRTDAERTDGYRHLERHYRKLGRTAPELLEGDRLDAVDTRSLLLESEWAIYQGERMEDATERLREALVDVRDAASEMLDVMAGDETEEVEDDPTRDALASIRDALPELEDESEEHEDE